MYIFIKICPPYQLGDKVQLNDADAKRYEAFISPEEKESEKSAPSVSDKKAKSEGKK
jgi:hypothetical protein